MGTLLVMILLSLQRILLSIDFLDRRVFEPCIDCFRSIRLSSLKQNNEQQLDNGDGYHHIGQKKSTLCV
ncbi:unnamed protein product [Rotaria sp. Silwood2]|nr:unnamed protein product [Rotaria sp. Silwood2]